MALDTGDGLVDVCQCRIRMNQDKEYDAAFPETFLP